MTRVVAVVQARCGSERLGEKVLAPLAGRAVIDHVLDAVTAASLVDDVVLATTTKAQDDPLASLGANRGVRVFRGSESDVLGRFVEALAGDPADVVVRLTGDDPLLDPNVINLVIARYLKEGCDYASNMIERSWPRGLDTEVISREALERSHAVGELPEYREHVTLYVRTHDQDFRLVNESALPQETWPELRLCVDTSEDLALLEAVFGALYTPGRLLRVGQVITWLREHPEVAALNAGVEQKRVLGRSF